MRIAIIGAGNVGGGLGAALTQAGHEVVFGVRDPDSDKSRAAISAAPGSRAAAPHDAVADADVVVFALRWGAVPTTVSQLPPLEGRVVIDAMNRIGPDPERSTSEDLAELLPGARVVKAFNTIGFENLATARGRHAQAGAVSCLGQTFSEGMFGPRGTSAVIASSLPLRTDHVIGLGRDLGFGFVDPSLRHTLVGRALLI